MEILIFLCIFLLLFLFLINPSSSSFWFSLPPLKLTFPCNKYSIINYVPEDNHVKLTSVVLNKHAK